MELDAAGNHIENNGRSITEKIQKQINFWQRFSLSFPSCVNIAKPMLYSQLNYLGSIIDFEKHWYERWEKLITTYVKGVLNIAKDQFFFI
jgi:predicted small secreted protein